MLNDDPVRRSLRGLPEVCIEISDMMPSESAEDLSASISADRRSLFTSVALAPCFNSSATTLASPSHAAAIKGVQPCLEAMLTFAPEERPNSADVLLRTRNS